MDELKNDFRKAVYPHVMSVFTDLNWRPLAAGFFMGRGVPAAEARKAADEMFNGVIGLKKEVAEMSDYTDFKV